MDEQQKAILKQEPKQVLNVPSKNLPITPITLSEIEEEIKKRVSLIDDELTRGFEFIKNQPKSVTVFGSARFNEDSKYYQLARKVGARLAQEGYAIVTGGGPGIMEAANRGAIDANGISLGLNIKLPHEQVHNPYLTSTTDFYYFFTRKVMLTFSAEAYLMFPGGFGTFDEAFEILTLVQTHKIEDVPVILVGTDFWAPFKEFIVKYMLNENHTIDSEDINLLKVTDDVEEIVSIVKKAPVRDGVRLHHSE